MKLLSLASWTLQFPNNLPADVSLKKSFIEFAARPFLSVRRGYFLVACRKHSTFLEWRTENWWKFARDIEAEKFLT